MLEAPYFLCEIFIFSSMFCELTVEVGRVLALPFKGILLTTLLQVLLYFQGQLLQIPQLLWIDSILDAS